MLLLSSSSSYPKYQFVIVVVQHTNKYK